MFKNSKRHFSYVIFILTICSVIAVKPQSLTYTSYTTKDGLPSNIITAIFQDSKGYIWIGTNNGLAKYNGADFTIYTTSDGLSNNWITKITEDPLKQGTIWIGTIAGGVNKFNNGKIHSYKYGNDPDWNNISDFCIDKNGIVWIIASLGFLKIEDDSIKIVRDKNAPLTPSEILMDKDGNIWCSEKNQVYIHKYSTSSWKKLNLQLKESSEIVSIIQDSENKNLSRSGGIWLGTSDRLIIELNDTGIIRKEKTLYGVPNRMEDNGEGSILIRDRDLFFSVSKQNLAEQKLLPFPKNEDMPWDVTSPFIIDREDNIWIGTWLKGLLKISDLSLISFQFPGTEKLNWSNIDQQGNIWIGAEGGVWEIYSNINMQWQKRFHPLVNYGKNSKIFISLIDSQNNLWLSINGKTYANKIINRKDQSSNLTNANLENLLVFINSRTLLAIFSDRQNRLWFSIAESGVGTADLKTGKILKFYTVEDGIPWISVKVIYQDHSNQIWMGGWQQGISIFSDNLIPTLKKRLTVENGLPDNMIRSVYEDSSGNIWIGTRHKGLVILKNGDISERKYISMKDGLRSNAIWDIVKGPGSRMWINTDVGIEQIDLTSLNVLPQKKEFLQSVEWFLSIRNYKDKYWCFSTNDELYIYQSNGKKNKNISPPVDITKVSVNGNNFFLNELRNLSYSQNNITIEFAGLSFKEEQAVTYQYRLIGTADTNWTKPSNHRYVSFASLRPGEYDFQVRAINSDGVMSKVPATLQFTIVPPFWMQWWFILAANILLLLFLFLIHRFRIKQLLKIESLRVRISSDLHDEIGSSVGSIVLRSRMLQKEDQWTSKAKDELERIQHTAAQTSEVLRDIVWLVNPGFDTLDDMILKMKDTAQLLLAGISYEFLSPDEVLSAKLSLEFRRNIFLSYKEILHNITKHSKTLNVKIKVMITDGTFSLIISDDGVGFDYNAVKDDKLPAGNGLKNINKRMIAVNGKVEIQSALSKGTTITLTAKTT